MRVSLMTLYRTNQIQSSRSISLIRRTRSDRRVKFRMLTVKVDVCVVTVYNYGHHPANNTIGLTPSIVKNSLLHLAAPLSSILTMRTPSCLTRSAPSIGQLQLPVVHARSRLEILIISAIV